MSRETITACLIVRDEAARLPEALRSVAFCDEVVVVDGGSVDATMAIARAAGAQVIERPWPGFARQRNVAIDHAHGDWILEIDADERVTPALRDEILALLADPGDTRLCGLPRRERFLGAWLGPAAKCPNYQHRLFRRGAYRHDESRTVHEGMTPRDPVRPLAGDLQHLLADGWAEALRDAWTYARLEAAQTPAPAGPAAAVRALVARPPAKLAYRLVVDGGWRDGGRGAAKIALECASDALVAARRLLAGESGPAVEPWRPAPRASPRIVALAGARDRERAERWLAAARAAGADVALIADGPAAGDVRGRQVPRLGPLHVIRAVDAESQLRAIDLLVASPGRAHRLARLVPGALRGGRPPARLEAEPAATVAALRLSR